MSADELREWLEGDASKATGWSKDDGSGESVGHERCGQRLYMFVRTVRADQRSM